MESMEYQSIRQTETEPGKTHICYVHNMVVKLIRTAQIKSGD